MPNELSFLAAFVIGLSGGLHCLAMCGGISGALGYASNQNFGREANSQVIFALAYNCGRICSYAFVGLVFGSLVSLLDAQLPRIQGALQILSAVLLILIGLHISGLTRSFTLLETWGAKFWKMLQPLALKLFPVTTLLKAFGLGMFWGWLPCGLVYSTLAWSATAASPFTSAAMMAFFGLGTLPWLLATTLAGQQIATLTKIKALRLALGSLLILIGIYSLYSSLAATHQHHTFPQSYTPTDTHDEKHHHH